MEPHNDNSEKQCCLICLQGNLEIITLPDCKHKFCLKCLKQYIDTLKRYNLLTPQKLICLAQNCKNQLSDQIIQKLYPGQQGFVLVVVKKRYKQSKDPSIKIFNCKGFTKSNRQNLIQKPSTANRQQHSKLMNKKMEKILSGQEIEQNKKMCTNILSFNKFSVKEKYVLCYVCGVSYCTSCDDFYHEGHCKKNQASINLEKYKKNISQNIDLVDDPDKSIQAYLNANSMTKCLNPKCGLPIAKQQGCFWVKCRCSWQFCYPCQKIWGDCQHFSKYPYKKFVAPPQWMVKALNLY